MEAFLLLIVLLLLIFVLNRISGLRNEVHHLNRQLGDLKNSQDQTHQTLQDLILRPAETEKIKTVFENTLEKEVVLIPEKEITIQSVQAPLENTIEETEAAAISMEAEERLISEPSEPALVSIQHSAPSPFEIEPKKSWYQSFKEQNPDWEKFIGENIINKIGILILVLGVSFFVKYAIDKDWISEPLRVGIGILVGSGVLLLAHRLRVDYKSFSSVLVAGAISIYYLTIAIAFHDYHLFGQTTAFAIMVVITALSVGISVAYDRQELAIMSLVGGFAVPFIVSTGNGNPIVLLSYIAILDAGVLAVAYFKKWNLTIFLAFIFTTVLLNGWFYAEGYDQKRFGLALVFSSILYLMFSIISIAGNIRNKGKMDYMQYSVLLLNTASYYSIGHVALDAYRPGLIGLFTLSLAFYNLAFAFILFKRLIIDRNAVYLLVGLALTFATLTIPLQFSRHHITLFWAAEAVLLFWLSRKSGIARFKLVAVVVQALMLFSLMIDWQQGYSFPDKELPILFNSVFVTSLFAVLSLCATYKLLQTENETSQIWKLRFDPLLYRKIALLLIVVVAYAGGLSETMYQSKRLISNPASSAAIGLSFHLVYCFGLWLFAPKSASYKTILLLLNAFNVVLFAVVNTKLPYNEIYENINSNTNWLFAFGLHFVNLAIVAVVLYRLFQVYYLEARKHATVHNALVWAFALIVILILSNELLIGGHYFNRNIVNFATVNARHPVSATDALSNLYRIDFIKQHFIPVTDQIVKIGFPVLWGLLSFLWLILGVKISSRQIRIVALGLLAATVAKLFLYDIRNVSETGKIVAFIMLGVLILVISFVYQKIKKLISEDNPVKTLPNDPAK